MEWYFIFLAILLASISGNSNRRLDRLERKISLLLERIDVDADEIDAQIEREEQKSMARTKALRQERVQSLIASTLLGGAAGYPIGLLLSPMLGLYSEGLFAVILWVPIGMAGGLLVGMFLARTGNRQPSNRIQ